MRHPRLETLVAYAENALPGRARGRLVQHLDTCSRCRREIAALRDLDRALLGLHGQRLAAPPWARIEARQDAEVRTADRGLAVFGWPVWAIAAGLGALALGATVLVVRPQPAAAGASDLRATHLPGDGVHELVRVEFTTAGSLSGEDALVVRGESWAWNADKADPEFSEATEIEAPMERRGAGGFEGRLQLPPETVFAWLIAEDRQGHTVDPGPMPRWEFLQRDDDGLPTRQALVQRLNAYVGLNADVAIETAEELTRRFPDDPFGWSRLAALRIGWARAGGRDSLVRVLRRLDDRYRHQRPDAETTAALFAFARRLGDDEIRGHWRSRLLTDHPTHVLAGNERIADVFARFGDDPEGRLAAFEGLWSQGGDRATTSLLGFQIALATAPPDVVSRWAARVVAEHPSEIPAVVRGLSGFPSLREEAVSTARQALDALELRPRPLLRSVSEHQRELRHSRAALLAALSAALDATGAGSASSAALEQAATLIWDPDLFRLLATRRLAAADTTGVAEMLARLVVDPLTLEDHVDPSVQAMVDRTTPSWNDLRARSESQLRAFIEEGLVDIPLPRAADLSLTGLASSVDQPILMTYWHTRGPEIEEGVRELSPYLEELAEAGIGVVGMLGRGAAVAEGRPGVLDDVPIHLLTDQRGQVADVIHRWPRASYFVVDTARRIRFAGGVAEAVRAGLVLTRPTAP